MLVALADDARGVSGAVEDVLELGLEERALLLDHEDLVESGRELAHDLRLERPDHPKPEDADAPACQLGFAEPELAQRVLEIVVGLACRDDAEPPVALPLDAVDAVLARVGEREIGADAEEGALQVERRRRQEVAVRHVLVAQVGHYRGDAAGRHLGGTDRVCHARDDLEASPQPGRPRAGVGVQAEVDHLGGGAGVEHRHVQAGEQRLGRARDRGGLAARVVADDGQPAAGARDADEVAVAQRIRGAVEPRGLSVPHAEHAVVLGAGKLTSELATPGRRRAELLVERGHVGDQVLVEQLAVARKLDVEPAERRALVARDQRAGREPAAPVGAVLVEHEAHERLHARDQDAALLEHVLVVETDLAADGRAAAVGRALAPHTPRRSRHAAARQCRLPRHW